MKPIIQSEKHYVQSSLFTVTASTITDILVSFAKETAAGANEVRVGTLVKAIYIEYWVRTQSTSPGSVLLTLYKTSSNASAMTVAESAALHDYKNKNNILYHTQGLTNDQDADAIPFIRQWIRIPKGKQRIALGEAWRIAIHAQGALDLTVCGFSVYKAFF